MDYTPIKNENLIKLIQNSSISDERKQGLIGVLPKLSEMEKSRLVINLRMQEMLDQEDEFEEKMKDFTGTKEEFLEKRKQFEQEIIKRYQKQAEEEKIEKIREELKES